VVRRWRAGAVALGLGVALTLAACSDDGDVPPGTDGPTEEPVDEPSADADEPAEGEASDGAAVDDPADEAADDTEDPASGTASEGEPLATVVHDVPDTEGAQLTVEVRSMEVVGELLRVGVAFTPTWDDDPELTLAQLLGAGPAAPGAGVGLRLIDPVNLLEYRPVRPSLPNGESVQLVDGSTLLVPFYLGAPEETPETFDVHLDVAQATGSFPPLQDVPFEAAG
jgi:hypothetical protein